MYGYKKRVKYPYEEAVRRTREELKKEGFGVLTEIDVKATLKQKLNVDYDKYIILGACNPPFAYKAFQAERDIGLLMPCNVIVYEQDGETFVSAMLLTVVMSVVNNDKLESIGNEVEQKLKKVIDSV
jgi:uncharacterized protein (DUF302 family)